MIKVRIDNVVLNNAETIYFTALSDEDGPCGNFKLTNRDAEKFGKHKVGEEFQLVVKPIEEKIEMPEFKYQLINMTTGERTDATEKLKEAKATKSKK